MNKRQLLLCGSLLTAFIMLAGGLWFVSDSARAEGGVPFPDQRDSIEAAANWLVTTHQNSDGGFTSFSQGADLAPSDPSGTLDAIIGIAATGYNPAYPLYGNANAPVDYLRSNSADLETYADSGGGQAGKTVLGLVAANQDPYNFEGVDYVAKIQAFFQTDPIGETPYNYALAMLGVVAAQDMLPTDTVPFLQGMQAGNGSWDDGFGTVDNADATAMAVMAQIAAGESPTNTSLMSATQFLADAQLPTGGFEYGTGFGENANSTALVVQALDALGEDFYTAGGTWDAGAGATPLMALLGWQNVTGAFQADFGGGPFDDFFSTVQAIPGAAGKAFPYLSRYQSAMDAVACLTTLRDPVTGGWAPFEGASADAGGTSRAMQAFHRAGSDLNDPSWDNGDGVYPIDALEALTPDYLMAGRGGRVGIVMQGAIRGNGTVRDFGGHDLVLAVSGYLSPTGEYDSTAFGPFAHAEAMLGLSDSFYRPDPTAVTWLENSADTDGLWGSADGTGIAMQALAKANGMLPTETLTGVRTTQLPDGGWGFNPSGPNSTSEIAQGLWAQGVYPYAPAWSMIVDGTVINSAETIMLQQLDSGCWIGFGGGDDPYSTTDAIIMMMVENDTVAPSSLFLPIIANE